MAIIRVEKNKENPYVIINKTALNDNSLSFKAKGIFAYLMSRPDDWRCQVNDLKNHAKDGRDSIYAGLKELREHGYMIKRPIKNERNIIIEWEEVLYETPQEEAKEIFKTQQEANEKAILKRADNMRKKKNKNPLTENPDMVENYEKSIYGKTVNGKTVNGKTVNIINNELLNTNLLTNEISCSKKDQFSYLVNLYSEHYGVITNGRKRKLYDYFAKCDFNFEFMKAVIEYVIDQRANKHSYFDNTIESLFKKEIITLERFIKSIQDYYKKKSVYEKINKSKDKNLRFNDFEQRNYDDDFYNKLGESLNPANDYAGEEDEEDIIKSFLKNKKQVEI